jgi:hypothetical protein
VRKQVDAAQIAGQQSIVFDNVPPGVAVAAVGVLGPLLSERYREVRKLGESVTYRVPCNQLTLFTGNNISIVEDLTRRVIDCRLDAEGDPLDRQFQHPDLLEIASRRRAEFISAVFTVAAAYEAAGAPTVNALPMPGYGQWCAWVQRPLIWLGVADPVLSTRALMGEDPAREALEAVCRLWYALHGEEWIAAANLLPAVTSTNDQRRVANELRARVTESVTVDKQGRINTKSLGRWLRRHLGKWTSDGLILQREAQGPRDKTAHRWRVFKRVTRGYSGSQRVSPIPFADENREGGEKEEENAAYRKPVDSFETREHPPAFSSSAATSTNKPVKPDGGDDSLSAVDVSDLIPANPADDDDDVPL